MFFSRLLIFGLAQTATAYILQDLDAILEPFIQNINTDIGVINSYIDFTNKKSDQYNLGFTLEHIS